MTGSLGRWSGWWREHPLAVDAVLALLVFAVTLQPLVRAQACGCAPTPAWGYALVVAECLPLVWRRTWPFATVLVTGLLTGVHGASSLPDPPVAFAGLVAIYTVAAHATRRVAVTAGVIGAVTIAVVLLVSWPDSDLEDATVVYLTFATAWLLGDATRSRRERTAELEARAADLERTRAAEARRAVVEERTRIAREMHDVLAHSVSMIVVQAEAGPLVVERDPARAVAAFDAISATGKEALRELRRLLGVLREDEAGPLAPLPGLADVQELVERVRRAGLDVELVRVGDDGPVPPAVGLSAYRIVQEALTNVVKHAGPAHVTVRLRSGQGTLRIEVTDDGLGSPAATPGRGLLGMHERADSLGGHVTAGPRPDGGWAVTADLPLDPVPQR